MRQKQRKAAPGLILGAALLASAALLMTACPTDTEDTVKSDKTALTAAISAAEAARAGVDQANSAEEVVLGKSWVTAAVWSALDTAINEAKAVEGKSSVSQAEVDLATLKLETAVKTFNDAKAEGTKTSGFTADDLAAFITEAQALKAGVEVSAEAGTDKAASVYWVTQEVMSAFDAAIAAAQAVTAAPYDEACLALTAAMNDFTAAKQPGTNNPGVSKGGKPATPLIDKKQQGIELLNLAGDVSAASNRAYVISLTWKRVEGAASYNVYMAEQTGETAPVKPDTAVASALTDRWYFARNLKAETTYWFWLEAVNEAGSTLGAGVSETTGKIDGYTQQKAGDNTRPDGVLERGDYARDISTVPGDSTLTVSWSLSDRIGWYEVYYKDNTELQLDDATAGGAISGYMYGHLEETGTDNLVPYILPRNIAPASADGWMTGDYPNQLYYDGWTPVKADGTAGTVGTPEKIFATSITIKDLTNGTNYAVYIRAPNANGERGISFAGGTRNSIGTPTTAAPAAAIDTPTGVKITGKTYYSADVEWNKVTGAASYRVYASKFNQTPDVDESFYTTVPAGAEAKLSATVNALDANTMYYLWVIALDYSGKASDFGPALTFATEAEPSTGGGGTIPDKIALNGAPMKNIVYIEVNDNDPRIALGYVLEQSNTQFFDYVILFAANLRNRDCLNEGSAGHDCTKQGVHLHFNGNVSHILDNRDKYIKPLQDKGIKVILGLLGDWGGVGFGSFENWPMEDVYPWATEGNPGQQPAGSAVYPYTTAVRDKFLQEVKDAVDQYGLDGVDFDDEWASANQSTKGLAVYPGQASYGSGGIGTTGRWQKTGVNMARLIYKARQLMPSPKYTITVFEWQAARYMNVAANLLKETDGVKLLDAVFDPATNTYSGGTASIAGISDYFDYITEAAYGSWNANGYNAAPHAKYAPVGIDVCGGDNPSAPRPPITGSTSLAVRADAELKAADPYGVNMFYALTSQAIASKPFSGQTYPKLWDNSRLRALTQAEYLSLLSSVLYGENVIYVGPDYPQDWVKR